MTKKGSVPWNRTNAAHLLVRTGFGATPDQIDSAAGRSFEEVVEDVLKPAPAPQPPSWVQPGIENKPDYKAFRGLPEEERREKRKMERKQYAGQHRELVGWWYRQMVSTPSPLQEKMTLFWHGHFATSQRKVKVPYMMYQQNQTLRQHALGNWKDLITAVSQDPAMLIYLDNTRSKASAPNENYARELMELFTLGEGHYSEQDIKESARAFTGWSVDRKTYTFKDATRNKSANSKNALHDNGRKTFFEQTGDFDGHDIIRIILEQDQAARFMVTKLWKFMAYDTPEPELIEQLSKGFRTSDYSISALMRQILLHPQFYCEKALHTQIKSPAQWLAGSCIALGMEAPDPAFCLKTGQTLGQELFVPPNVKGWDGGYAWITTSSLTQRYNLSGQLVNYRSKGAKPKEGSRKKKTPYAVNAATVLPESQRTNTETARRYLEQRIYQAELTAVARENLNTFLASQPPPTEWTAEQIHRIVHVMMSTPQYQLT